MNVHKNPPSKKWFKWMYLWEKSKREELVQDKKLKLWLSPRWTITVPPLRPTSLLVTWCTLVGRISTGGSMHLPFPLTRFQIHLFLWEESKNFVYQRDSRNEFGYSLAWLFCHSVLGWHYFNISICPEKKWQRYLKKPFLRHFFFFFFFFY